MKQNILGVIGGLGPLATAHFMERVVEMTDAKKEQDHVDMIVYNFPSIPDRTGYILGSNLKSPLPGLLNAARALERQGVGCIAIPCVTAHYFYLELQSAVSVPVLNALSETAALLKAAGVSRAGIMATDGTIRARLLTRTLESAGICPVLPSEERQADVMHLIYENVKAEREVELDRFQAVRQELEKRGSEVIILGCTELSVIRREYPLEGRFLDVLDVLAQTSVLRCGKKIRLDYKNLLEGGKGNANQYLRIFGRKCPARTGKDSDLRRDRRADLWRPF